MIFLLWLIFIQLIYQFFLESLDGKDILSFNIVSFTYKIVTTDLNQERDFLI